jgi:hypothetical protein
VSVTGFDNEAITRATTPPLTTYRQPYPEIGVRAVAMLVELIQNPPRGGDTSPSRLLLPGEMVFRESAAAPAPAIARSLSVPPPMARSSSPTRSRAAARTPAARLS